MNWGVDRKRLEWSRVLLLAVIVGFACSVRIHAQAQTTPPAEAAKPDTSKQEAAPAAKKDEGKPTFKLTVSDENILAISLHSENTRLADIAAELSRKLKIPVVLSAVMSRQKTGAKFSDLLLEPAMQLLAPCVFIDYEVDSAPGARPRPLGIFLNAYNELPPASNAVVKFKSQAFVISGNTETKPGEEDEDDPIKISYKNGSISVNAKDQNLLDVISDISEETGIPFEGPDDLDETVSVNIKDRPLEDALLQLSPNLKVYVRYDSQRGTRTVLRIVVVERTKNP